MEERDIQRETERGRDKAGAALSHFSYRRTTNAVSLAPHLKSHVYSDTAQLLLLLLLLLLRLIVVVVVEV